MKILVLSDAHKGGLSSLVAGKAIAQGLRRASPEAQVTVLQAADGGEGTLEAFLALEQGVRHRVRVQDPLGRPVNAQWGALPGGRGILEMASASGLTLLKEKAPMAAHTYGCGQLIQAALDQGVKQLWIGLGGSATTDGGIGMARALGVRFLNARGEALNSGGEDLLQIAKIDLRHLDPRLKEVEIRALGDVTNPLFGSRGAARVFGPQKGATSQEVKQLDQGLAHLAACVKSQLGLDLAQLPGAGAAGGLGYGLMVFAGARIQSGIEVLLKQEKMQKALDEADLIITGEGRFDGQSLMGKLATGVLKEGNKRGCPVCVVAGALGPEAEQAYGVGFAAMEGAVCEPMTLEEALARAPELLERAAWRLMMQLKQ